MIGVRRSRILAIIIGLLVVWVVCGLRLSGAVGAYVSNTSVSAAERAEVAAYYVAHTKFYDHHTYAACPLHLLGAHRDGASMTVYGTVHCWTGDVACHNDSDWTAGVVAHLVHGKVASEQYDNSDMPDPQALQMYPRALRGAASDLMNYDGPSGADRTAKQLAGC